MNGLEPEMVGWTHDQWVKRSLACWVDGFIKDEWSQISRDMNL